jgi:hypothetical protein
MAAAAAGFHYASSAATVAAGLSSHGSGNEFEMNTGKF